MKVLMRWIIQLEIGIVSEFCTFKLQFLVTWRLFDSRDSSFKISVVCLVDRTARYVWNKKMSNFIFNALIPL